MKVFRWKAIGPLLLVFVGVVVLWWLFADRIAHRTAEEVGTSLLGARVDIERLHLDLSGVGVDVVEDDLGKAVEGCDCVVLCVPVGAYAGVMARIAPHLAPGCVLTDVGSTKGSVVHAGMRVTLPHDVLLTANATLPLTVLYEDAWLVAVDKPGGTPSHPLDPRERDTAGRNKPPNVVRLDSPGRPLKRVHPTRRRIWTHGSAVRGE